MSTDPEVSVVMNAYNSSSELVGAPSVTQDLAIVSVHRGHRYCTHRPNRESATQTLGKMASSSGNRSETLGVSNAPFVARLLARQCGAAGLPNEAKRLFGLGREASGPERACGIDFLAYRAAAGVLGWTLAGRAACSLDALKR
jgi:hypothetical protein